MKIILLTDVSKVGKRGDVKEVNDGYARNFLIARKLAEPATPGAVSRLENSRKALERERELERENIKKAVESFKENPLEIVAKATPEGHLFAGITREKIAEMISKKSGTHFPADVIMLEKPLKGVGEYNVPVHFADTKLNLRINIKATE